MTKTIIIGGALAGFAIAIALSWILASAFISFVFWDWMSASSSGIGRVVWAWLFIAGTIGGNGMTGLYRKFKP